MKTYSFNVIPNLPEKLRSLQELSTNMWFTWNWEAIMMFVGIDEDLWHRSHRNPKWILGALPYEKLEALGNNEDFLKKLSEIKSKFDSYMSYQDTWFNKNKGEEEKDLLVAYFSMEYGIGEGLPIYSGGLGMLSGDHLKSASDMGMPVIGVGLLYRKGYVQQVLNRENWQTEKYPENDWYNMPVEIVKDAQGHPLKVSVDLAGENVVIGVWRVPVGRTSLYLLDTNLPENSPAARVITEQLYGGDRDNRIRQEIVLGVGGYRALKAMGLRPQVFHVNEGHSAFLLLERIKDFMEERHLNFDQAREIVWASSVFTTHTPVMAGNEYFDFELIKRYFEKYCSYLGISFPELLELGKEEKNSLGFCMTVMAMKLCAYINAVSWLHMETTKDMWYKVWPQLPKYELPIDYVTNGVHTSSWISHEHYRLYKKNIHNEGSFDSLSFGCCDWSKINSIDEKEWWDNHLIRKQKLIKLVRERLSRQYQRLGYDHTVIEDINKILDPNYLTIGFARRFATYKRATLFMKNLERLMKLTNNDEKPVQFVIAGKAHQADSSGKEFIKAVAALSLDKRFKSRVVFVEDYNMNVARYMVQGVDVWLNNPIRPLEASGTSGMKAAINGALNLSILDGWWVEGYDKEVGWAIGGSEHYRNDEERDYVEAESLYNLLEKVIIPLYYEKEDGLPKEWIRMMKKSVSKLVPQFNTDRMLKEYYEKFYVKGNRFFKKLTSDEKVKEVSKWRGEIRKNWENVRVIIDNFKPDMEIRSGAIVPLRAIVWLGGLNPQDVKVQTVVGNIDGESIFKKGVAFDMKYEGKLGDAHIYTGGVKCYESGRHDFAVRVIPNNENIPHQFMPFFIKWNDN
ncbi:MAG: glycosyltransferase family 1 protein [Elusimicrobiota bacterium]